MTPRTTARPTIVRTRLPPDGAWAVWAAPAVVGRGSAGVVLAVGREGGRSGEQAAEDGRGNGVEGTHRDRGGR